MSAKSATCYHQARRVRRTRRTMSATSARCVADLADSCRAALPNQLRQVACMHAQLREHEHADAGVRP
eukprot:1449587-Alexandrium_andersonii.AAC.1